MPRPSKRKRKMRTEENYDVFYNKIREKYSHREREIKFVNKLLTLITYFAYPAMAAYLFVKGDRKVFKGCGGSGGRLYYAYGFPQSY